MRTLNIEIRESYLLTKAGGYGEYAVITAESLDKLVEGYFELKSELIFLQENIIKGKMQKTLPIYTLYKTFTLGKITNADEFVIQAVENFSENIASIGGKDFTFGNEVLMDNDQFFSHIESLTLFKEKFEEFEKEQRQEDERILKRQQEQKHIVLENQYKQFLALQKKMENGDFERFTK
ncbi:MAG: hypothetical protein GY827_04775 [Cytophagales bacterium]|nr:hypothetical protein [Cytophagales bacterium]